MESTKSASASGLQTIVDVIVAPATAFERLRTAPTWGWAFIISLVLSAAASFAIIPAVEHAMTAGWPAMVAQNPRLAQLPPDQQQQMLSFTLNFVKFSWIFVLIGVPFFLIVQTVVMFIFKAIGHGTGSFVSLWAAAVNICVPIAALSNVVAAIIVTLRGPTSFNSQAAITSVLPSLALLAPGAAPKVVAFLSAINIFTLWGLVLNYLAMRITAGVSAVPAACFALILLLALALLQSLGAH